MNASPMDILIILLCVAVLIWIAIQLRGFWPKQ